MEQGEALEKILQIHILSSPPSFVPLCLASSLLLPPSTISTGDDGPVTLTTYYALLHSIQTPFSSNPVCLFCFLFLPLKFNLNKTKQKTDHLLCTELHSIKTPFFSVNDKRVHVDNIVVIGFDQKDQGPVLFSLRNVKSLWRTIR